MGTVLSLTPNSNDVRVHYTDLNATLASLQTEQGTLLKFMSQSSSIDSTLAIEAQQQGVDRWVNEVESETLQTKTCRVRDHQCDHHRDGGASPAVAHAEYSPCQWDRATQCHLQCGSEGRLVAIHYQLQLRGWLHRRGADSHPHKFPGGTYKILVSATNQSGMMAKATTAVIVVAERGPTRIIGLVGYVGNLFLGVVKRIIEVPAVVLPLAVVGTAIVVPIQKYNKKVRQIQ